MRKKTFFVLVACLSLLTFPTFMSLAAPKQEIGPPSNANIPDFAPIQKRGAAGMLEVLSPRAPIPPVPNLPLSPRLANLDGKTIGLYDNQKQGTTAFQDVIEELIHNFYPSVTVKRYRGPFEISDATAAQLAQEVDAVIFGNGD